MPVYPFLAPIGVDKLILYCIVLKSLNSKKRDGGKRDEDSFQKKNDLVELVDPFGITKGL